jgi:hypothetical protein
LTAYLHPLINGQSLDSLHQWTIPQTGDIITGIKGALMTCLPRYIHYYMFGIHSYLIGGINRLKIDDGINVRKSPFFS